MRGWTANGVLRVDLSDIACLIVTQFVILMAVNRIERACDGAALLAPIHGLSQILKIAAPVSAGLSPAASQRQGLYPLIVRKG